MLVGSSDGGDGSNSSSSYDRDSAAMPEDLSTASAVVGLQSSHRVVAMVGPEQGGDEEWQLRGPNNV